MRCDFPILNAVVAAVIAAALSCLWEAHTCSFCRGDSCCAWEKWKWEAERWGSIASPERRFLHRRGNWPSRWFSAYHHFISHNTLGTWTPTAGCRSMRRSVKSFTTSELAEAPRRSSICTLRLTVLAKFFLWIIEETSILLSTLHC